MKYLTTEILTRERSEEEKRRRHLHGDKGAKFSLGKVPKIDRGGGAYLLALPLHSEVTDTGCYMKKWTRKDFNIVYTLLPNGNIRTHLDDYKKTSISECQFINPRNIAPTIIAGGGHKGDSL